MTFFYDLNKRLDAIRELPATTHQQLNESKPAGDTKEPMKKAAKEKPDYKSKMQDKFGGSAADLTKGLSIKSKKVDEGNYSKDAMELNPDFAKVGKKPGVMGKIAQGVKKVADFVAPGDEDLMRDLERKTGGRRPAEVAEETGLNKSVEAASKIINKTDPYSEHVGSLGSNHVFFSGSSGSDEHIYHIFNDKTKETDTVSFYHEGTPQSLKDIAAAVYDYNIAKIIHSHHEDNLDESANLENLDESIDFDKVLDAIAALYGPDIWDNDAMQDLANDLEQAGPTDRELDFIIAKGKLPKRLANTQFSAGDNVRFGEGAAPMTPKQKSFAKLAPPANKITFADKIAGAKKEVDEMLGDVAAEAMKAALGKGKQPTMGEATKEIPGGRRHTAGPGGYGRKDDEDAPRVQTQRGRGRPKKNADSETGQVMKPDFSAFGVTGKDVKLPKHKGAVTKHKMVGEESDPQTWTTIEDVEFIEDLMDRAFEAGSNSLGNTLQGVLEKIKYNQDDEEQMNEKAVSKKQQRFMGMVHAAKKGEKPASKEVARAAKGISAKEADKFASTKHKGLPEKAEEGNGGAPKKKETEFHSKLDNLVHKTFGKSPDEKKSTKTDKSDKKPAKKAKEEKVDETTVSGSVATAPAAGGKKSSGGINFGGSVYEAKINEGYNRRLTALLNEEMNVNMSDSTNGSKSLTVTATDEDAVALGDMLKMAGLFSSGGYSRVDTGHDDSCSECGRHGGVHEATCGHRDMVEEELANSADNTQYADTDTMVNKLSGGLNGRKLQVNPNNPGDNPLAMGDLGRSAHSLNLGRTDEEFDRMMEMAGVEKKAVDEEKTDEGNRFTGNLKKARDAGKKEADLDGDGDMEKVQESNLMQRLWKSYKG